MASDTLFVKFELRDHYGDDGRHLLFQDARFIQRYMLSIHVELLVVVVYISNKCLFFIDFHVLAFPGYSRAHHAVRLEQSVPAAPISSSVIAVRCRLYMVRGFCSWTTGSSCPQDLFE
jgi:hypothetical protein